ncbi:hypothetical protein LCGC14_0672590 [marine sediment metagenome]|uniref:Uncharacterized protein n=1 Tax=marine sediment metagenome TaxID=412755 RepID=A0A0F9QVM9_9ZZZZ
MGTLNQELHYSVELILKLAKRNAGELLHDMKDGIEHILKSLPELEPEEKG